MNHLDDALALTARLIAHPTVSSDSNLAMIADIASLLEDLGARVEVIAGDAPGKANLFASFGPDTPGGIMLSGHTDVVPVTDQDWSRDPFAAWQDQGRIYGRGSCDMKGFIAACLAIAPVIAARPLRRPLHLCLTHDEETGCLGAQALIPELRRRGHRPAIAIIGEPTGMHIIEGHKGCCEYTTRFSGLAGHGSAPERGVNAVEYAVRYVARLIELRAELKARAPSGGRFDPPWTTLNIGRLSGGFAHNVIAEQAEVEWEFRPVQDSDYRHLHQAISAYTRDVLLPEMRRVHPGAGIDTETIGEVAGLVPMPDNAARDLVAALTGENAAGLAAFGTEAGLFQAAGMDVVVCGPGSIAQAHKPDEYLEIAQLKQCLEMLARLGDRLEQPAARD